MTGPEILSELWNVIIERAENPSEKSYTSRILTHRKGIDKALEKVGEEATEFILAIKNRDKNEIKAETAELLFHMLIALKAAEVSPNQVYEELASRRR